MTTHPVPTPSADELVKRLFDQANELSCGDWTAMDLEDHEVSHKIADALREAAIRISSDTATGKNIPDVELLKAISGCQGILRQEGYIYPVTIFDRTVEGLVEQAARIVALESQLARKDEALRPFVNMLQYYGCKPSEYRCHPECTVGDLRRAAEALSSTPVQPETKTL